MSSTDQNTDVQFKALVRAGCKKVFKDELSGATTQRPALLRCLKVLRRGDSLVVWKLDRLARSLHDLIAIMGGPEQAGCQFQVVDRGHPHVDSRRQAVFHLFAALAEFERGLIIERTRAGMLAARARGVRPGPKAKLTRQQIEHARKMIDAGEAHQTTADLFNVSRVTLYRALAKVSSPNSA